MDSSSKSESIEDVKEFKVFLNVNQFKSEELEVKLVDNVVVVHGKHEERSDEHGFVSREFTRKYLLPGGSEHKRLIWALISDNVLVIQASEVIPFELLRQQCLDTSKQCRDAEEQCRKTMEQCREAMEQCQDPTEPCLEAFDKCLEATELCWVAIEQCRRASAQWWWSAEQSKVVWMEQHPIDRKQCQEAADQCREAADQCQVAMGKCEEAMEKCLDPNKPCLEASDKCREAAKQCQEATELCRKTAEKCQESWQKLEESHLEEIGWRIYEMSCAEQDKNKA